jgi:hypothetical protein
MCVKTSVKLLAVAVTLLAGAPAFAQQESYGHAFEQKPEACRRSPFESCVAGLYRAPHVQVRHSSPDDWPNDLILD